MEKSNHLEQASFQNSDRKLTDKLGEKNSVCPECGQENEAGALFCVNCGTAFSTLKQCPSCHAQIFPGADICESCGTWLLEGQCKFCYAPLEENTKFCPECGNPAEGVICPKCGNLSYFDFCKHCGIPLTVQAHQTIKELAKTLGMNISESTDVAPSEEVMELKKIKEYQKKIEENQKNGENKQLFKQKELNELIQNMEQSQNQSKELTQPELLQKLQQRTFKNNQEARRFFGALKVILPVVTSQPVGWLCKAYNCLHPDGPQSCANPAPGGEWIFNLKTDLKEVQI